MPSREVEEIDESGATHSASGGPGPRFGWMRVIVLAFALVAIPLAFRGLLGTGSLDPSSVKAAVRDLGALGPFLFVLGYALTQPFGVPGTAFVLAAPVLWPLPIAFACSLAGSVSSASLGFVFARFVARDALPPRLARRFAYVTDALERSGFRTVLACRALFFTPSLLHGVFGLSRLSFRTHFVASLLGYALPIFLMTYFAPQLLPCVASALERPGTVGVVTGFIVTAALCAVAAKYAWAKRARHEDEQP